MTISSCSLACTKSHKIYCAPKPNPVVVSEAAKQSSETDPAQEEHNADEKIPLKEIQEIFAQYPNLRSKLLDIYKSTLEQEWEVSGQGHSMYPNNQRHAFRHHHNSRGPWTAEKGFNRGVEKIRQWREGCEGGEFTDKDADGFMKFMAVVAGEREG